MTELHLTSPANFLVKTLSLAIVFSHIAVPFLFHFQALEMARRLHPTLRFCHGERRANQCVRKNPFRLTARHKELSKMTPVAEVEVPSSASTSLSAYGIARSTIQGSPLSPEELRKTDAYWRACKYLALGMIYLQANPLLKEPLKPEQIKNRLLGHWGSSPGLAFIHIHLNRLIKKFDLDMIFMAGPGHGAPGVLGPGYLEGTYSEIYPDKSG